MNVEDFARKIIAMIDMFGDNNIETISHIEGYCTQIIMKENDAITDLEKAALDHIMDVMEYEYKKHLEYGHMTSFKEGANWQKEHMLKDATEFTFDKSLPAVIDCRLRAMDIQYGDRLIIIKSDKVL